MTFKKLESVVSSLFFLGAFLLLIFSLIDWIVGRYGYRFLETVHIPQMLSVAALLLTFVSPCC